MCLLAKINDREFWAFYMTSGKVELRDENFRAMPLPVGPILVKDQLDPSDTWTEMPSSTLIQLAKGRMTEALTGLKNLSQA